MRISSKSFPSGWQHIDSFEVGSDKKTMLAVIPVPWPSQSRERLFGDMLAATLRFTREAGTH
jgi:hypothetical protein